MRNNTHRPRCHHSVSKHVHAQLPAYPTRSLKLDPLKAAASQPACKSQTHIRLGPDTLPRVGRVGPRTLVPAASTAAAV